MQKKIRLLLSKGILKAVTPDGLTREFTFPAAAVSINGKRHEAEVPAGEPVSLPDGGWQAEFTGGPCRFKVTLTPANANWFFKQVEIFSDTALPTPDHLEVDCQKRPAPGLKRRGYMCTSGVAGENQSSEEGGGIVPGCGYPLIGDDMFTGIEHPAAFNTVVSEENGITHWRLRHYPVWENGRITSCRAVIGISSTAFETFQLYVDTMRLPVLKEPLLAFCTFWSDPYAGNFEYTVNKDSYASLLEAFNKLDLHPTVYTLDAGWQDRNSFLRAKSCYGGEEALMKNAAQLRASGSDLSLWVSPNGPVGITNEFLRKSGVAVGKGESCHYRNGEYGVLMDKRLEDELTRRALELVSDKYGVKHFKVDWDNECAVSPEFAEKYPTRNHVREASLDVMARINSAMRKINPQIMTRNGRWPSPWHLSCSTHVSLPNGGDCEFSHLPSLNQRDASTTHRDFLYWCVFVRDGSAFPLDVLDNHEFSHSLRNPFMESPGVWSNTCVWAVMRGSSYHQLAFMPEALEDQQADILRHTMKILRRSPEKILTGRSRMFGDDPAAGSVYGFIHPGKNGSCVMGMRNSSPLPTEYVLPDETAFYVQTYPCIRKFRAGEKIVFAPHEVKVFEGGTEQCRTVPDCECQLFPVNGDKLKSYLPASQRPDVRRIHQIPEIKKTFFNEKKTDDGIEWTFGLLVPWRMRDFKVLFKISKKDCTAEKLHLRTSRFSNCRTSSYSVPLAEIPAGLPGSGELKNPDSIRETACRYFAADLPQGGEVFFSLTADHAGLSSADIELWVSGCEAPARNAEEKVLDDQKDLFLFLPHPEGFPRNMRLL